MYLSLHIYNTPHLIKHTECQRRLAIIRIPGMYYYTCFFLYIHVHGIPYNSEINNYYSYINGSRVLSDIMCFNLFSLNK